MRLGMNLDPEYLDTVWEDLLSNPNLREIAHAALELSTKVAPGASPEAIAEYEGITKGVALAIEVLRQSKDDVT